MPHWIRFEHDGTPGFGTLEGGQIAVHSGDMFDRPVATGQTLPFGSVRVLAPTQPSKMIALWNNFRALGDKLGIAAPEDPLYLLKASSCVTDPEATVHRPASYPGKVAFEGELAIVIGRVCKDASAADAKSAIFGFTCVNDITASDILNKDTNFAQWVRAKSFDGFGPFGPVIATDIRPENLWVRTILNGEERQRYPISDMVFSAVELVSRISHDMTLLPGDVICCGTSIGVGAMKEPINRVEVEIEGIGKLSNTFINA